MPRPAPKAPRHRVRPLTLATGTQLGWAIAPDQLAPMHRRIERNLRLTLRLRGAEEELAHRLAPSLATVALRAIGLPVT